ncbi:MAG: glyoxalase [Actinomycetota bacterium]|nr:glyoxalase [Actinomycetota bacterium]
MQIQFIATVAVITADPAASHRLYVDALGLPLRGENDGYHHSEQLAGSKSFGVWPLAQAAQACFGTPDWPDEHPAAELAHAGFPLLHEARLEPWGQTVARVLSPEGLIIGISYAPSLH